MRTGIDNIKDFLAEAHNLRQEVSNMRANIADTEKLINKVANDANSNLKLLQHQIENVARSAGSSADVSNLNSRISALESQISSLASSGGGSGSGGGVPVSKLNAITNAVSELISALNRGESGNDLNYYVSKIRGLLDSV